MSRRILTAAAVAAGLILAPAAAAQAGEQHHGQHQKSSSCTCHPRHHRHPKPKPPVCKPDCAGHGDHDGHHHKPPVCAPPAHHHPTPKPPHHRPPHHHGHKPPVKPTPPPAHPTPVPPVVHNPTPTTVRLIHPKPAAHVEAHKAPQALAYTGAGDTEVALLVAFGLIGLGGITYAGGRGSRAQTRAMRAGIDATKSTRR